MPAGWCNVVGNPYDEFFSIDLSSIEVQREFSYDQDKNLLVKDIGYLQERMANQFGKSSQGSTKPLTVATIPLLNIKS